jgi:hypothetical protein
MSSSSSPPSATCCAALLLRASRLLGLAAAAGAAALPSCCREAGGRLALLGEVWSCRAAPAARGRSALEPQAVAGRSSTDAAVLCSRQAQTASARPGAPRGGCSCRRPRAARPPPSQQRPQAPRRPAAAAAAAAHLRPRSLRTTAPGPHRCRPAGPPRCCRRHLHLTSPPPWRRPSCAARPPCRQARACAQLQAYPRPRHVPHAAGPPPWPRCLPLWRTPPPSPAHPRRPPSPRPPPPAALLLLLRRLLRRRRPAAARCRPAARAAGAAPAATRRCARAGPPSCRPLSCPCRPWPAGAWVASGRRASVDLAALDGQLWGRSGLRQLLQEGTQLCRRRGAWRGA